MLDHALSNEAHPHPIAYDQVLESRESLSSSSTHLRLVTEDERIVKSEVVEKLLSSKRKATTQRTYEVGLRAFFGGVITRDAVETFLQLPVPAITLRLLEFKDEMRRAGKSDATINNRVAAVRALLQFAYRLGLCATDGRGLVDGEKVQALRDTRGVDLQTVKDLLSAPEIKYAKHYDQNIKKKDQKTPLPVLRDRAILLLWCENAFRRGEVHKLDVQDFSHRGLRVWILGKGRGSKEPATISKTTADAIGAYILAAGHANTVGPLFRNFDRNPARTGNRLTEKSLYKLCIEYGNIVGIKNLNPHKLRHSAITLFLDDGGDLRSAQRLGRHKDIKTTMIYDDNRKDLAGEAVNQLSGLFHGRSSKRR